MGNLTGLHGKCHTGETDVHGNGTIRVENDLQIETCHKTLSPVPAAAATSGPSGSPTQSELLREDAAAQVRGCRRPSQAAQKGSSDEVTTVPEEETATNGHQT